MDDDVLVTMKHLRRLGYCSGGVRSFCARHGIDFSSLLRDGLPGSRLIEVGDAMGIAAVEEAKKDGQQ